MTKAQVLNWSSPWIVPGSVIVGAIGFAVTTTWVARGMWEDTRQRISALEIRVDENLKAIDRVENRLGRIEDRLGVAPLALDHNAESNRTER